MTTDLEFLTWLREIHENQGIVMLRAIESAVLPYDGGMVTITAGQTSISPDHEIVFRFPSLFETPPEREPKPPPPARPFCCWADGLRARAYWTLGRRHGDRRRRG